MLISNSFPVYVHAVFHFVPPLKTHNMYFGKHDKGDKSYKFMLQVANFHGVANNFTTPEPHIYFYLALETYIFTLQANITTTVLLTVNDKLVNVSLHF